MRKCEHDDYEIEVGYGYRSVVSKGRIMDGDPFPTSYLVNCQVCRFVKAYDPSRVPKWVTDYIREQMGAGNE